MKMVRNDSVRGTVTICAQETGKDWCNYLWNANGYQAEITHTGAVSSKFVSESSECLVLNEQKSGILYFRDDESGVYWNAGGWPSAVPVSSFRCVHGQDFSCICSKKTGIETETAYAVSGEFPYEVWRVIVCNRSTRPRRLSIFAGTVFRLDGYSQPFYYNAPTTSETVFSSAAQAVLCLSQNPYAKFRCRNAFIMSSRSVSSYEGYLDNFTGINGGLTRPYVLEKNKDLSCSLSTVRARCGILQNKVMLQPGESTQILYFCGFCEGEQDLADNRERMLLSAPELFVPADCRLAHTGSLRTFCPDERMNMIFNGWAEKQVRYCAIGKKAVRDNAQLAMGFLNFDAKGAKTTLAECLAHQYSDGHAALLWYPVVDQKLYSDPAFWLVWAVCEYLKETGERSFLQEEYPWLDGGAAPVTEHLIKAALWYSSRANQGEHGLPKIYYADWNDALNIPDENAESVFMGECYCLMMRELQALFTWAEDAEFAGYAQKEYAQMANRINACAWNGSYYVRAFSKFGTVGDRSSDYGKFYINTQSFAILAGIVPHENMSALLRSIDETVTEKGVRLCVPPYPVYDEHVGRMSGMLPGVYENGGIYNHAGCFKVMADCILGRGDKAFGSLSAIVPDGKFNPSEKTTVEPYVFVNCYLKHPSVDMKCGPSWQTGTSAWALRCYYEGILGIRRTYDGLKICPCPPSEWKNFTAERSYRNSRLHFTYQKSEGESKLLIDGKAHSGKIVPPFSDGKDHFITVLF